MFIEPQVSINIPEDMVKEGVNARATFIAAMENRMRPRFNSMETNVKSVTRYPAINPYYDVRRNSGSDFTSFGLVNDHPASEYLLQEGGTPAHIIKQRPHVIPMQNLAQWGAETGRADMTVDLETWAWGLQGRLATIGSRAGLDERMIVIAHPGTREDTNALRVMEDAMGDIAAAVERGTQYWMDRFGVDGGSG